MVRKLPYRQGKAAVAHRHPNQDLPSGQPAVLQTFPGQLLHREKRGGLQHGKLRQSPDQGGLR